jgi:UPF0716 family protein affecting phage T7 exclusion
MIKWLLFFGVLIGIGDPILLYFIYRWFGGWVLAGVMFGPLLLGTIIAQIQARRATQQDANAFPSMLVDAFLIPAARMMIMYPGPISSLAGLLLLIPAVRRLLSTVVMRRMMKNAFAGAGSGGFGMTGNMGGFSFSAGGTRPRTTIEPDGLKRADGKIVDDMPELEEPDEDFDNKPKKKR